jgi:hypothetical protein
MSQASVKAEPRYRFRLLSGTHHEAKWDMTSRPSIDRGRTYYQGEVIETDNDLSIFNGRGTASPKFALLSPETETVAEAAARGFNTIHKNAPTKSPPEPAGPSNKDMLDTMTVNELRKFAEDEEIELGDAKTKEQILKVVREAVGG